MGNAARIAESSPPVARILLVEDNPSDAYVVGSLLGEQNGTEYELCHVKTQAHAIEALDRHDFDVCLLDLTLPDATDFSALIDIQEKAPAMPTLILTGTDDARLARRAVGRGAQDYLLKSELDAGLLLRAIDYARERKRLEKDLFRRANFDALTGLVSRPQFDIRLRLSLARTERSGAGLALLFLDLDRFKPVNDTYGHEAGDEVLKTIARRIRATLRPYDTAARLGGDEFAVLLEGIASPRDAAAIAQKMAAVLSIPVPFRTRSLAVGASIGIAFAETAVKAETLLEQADVAMYRAKQEGGGVFRFYEPELHRRAELRLQSEDALRGALVRDELRLYYQPYVTPEGDAILGVEALLRWAHPRQGMLFPDDFIPLAEECRLMPEIAEWTLGRLARDIAEWNARAVPPLAIAFNLCASQLSDDRLPGWLAPVADRQALGHHCLAAEIHSEALSKLSQPLFFTLVRLREMGIALHVDHFGCGPVSLETLHSYPFTLLKLNLATLDAMRDCREEAVIRTAIELAHQLGMKAAAVGVETPSQMRMLKGERCDQMQGFFIGHPMTAAQLPQWLAARK